MLFAANIPSTAGQEVHQRVSYSYCKAIHSNQVVFTPWGVIGPAFLQALRSIVQRLEGQGIRWVLVGSASLALQGVDIRPKDIDILTDQAGALRFNELFCDYVVSPVRFQRSTLFDSYFGTFTVLGIKVEVMGDLVIKYQEGAGSQAHRLTNPHFVKLDELIIPVSPLSEQLASYEKLGRPKDQLRIQKIRAALKREGCPD